MKMNSKHKVGDKVLVEGKIIDLDEGAAYSVRVEFEDESTDWFNEKTIQDAGVIESFKSELLARLMSDRRIGRNTFEAVVDIMNEMERVGRMKSRKYTIYAVDFDGTLCESVYPGIGSPNIRLIEHLKKRRAQGNILILWTCRCGDRLKEAVEWCKQYGLEFDYVNENVPEMTEWYGNDCRKVFADVYIDDKAVKKPKYNIPYKERKE